MPIVTCYNCAGDPEFMADCHWCRGKGIIMDTGISPAALQRIPASLVAASADGEGALFALANDGTMWVRSFPFESNDWKRVRDLPQPESVASLNAAASAPELEGAPTHAPQPGPMPKPLVIVDDPPSHPHPLP